MAIIIALAILFSGGASVYVAEQSLPGDALYPVKIGINEKVEAALAVSDESEARLQTKLVARRLEEAEDLAAHGTISAAVRADIESRFEAHAKKVEDRIIKLEQMSKFDAAADISSNFETSLRAHEQVLTRLSEQDEEDGAELSKIVASVKAQLDTAANVRVGAESKIAGQANADVETAANGKLIATENKIEEVRSFVARIEGTLDGAAKAQIDARLGAAADLVVQGKAKLNAKTYSEAFNLFQKAQRVAQEAQLMAQAHSDLKIEVGLGASVRDDSSQSNGADTSTHNGSASADVSIEASARASSSNAGTGASTSIRLNF